jgi:fermentation-respiration switch protein FrsA (DUF1100 family)
LTRRGLVPASLFTLVALAACACIMSTALLGGCTPAKDINRPVVTNVSVDKTTSRATIETNATDGWVSIAVFVTGPDGTRTLLGSGNCGPDGAKLGTGELAAGDYTYTVYARPQEPGESGVLPDSEIVAENIAATGTFTIP